MEKLKLKTTVLMVFYLLYFEVSSAVNKRNFKYQDSISFTKFLEKNPPSINSENVIVKVFSRPGNIFDQECTSTIIVCFSSQNVKAFGVDCENEYAVFDYYQGNVAGLSAQGNISAFDNCGGSGVGPTMCLNNGKFEMLLSADSTSLKLNDNEYMVTKNNFTFNLNGMKLYDTPSITSKFKQAANLKGSTVELLEIGNLEKRGKSWKVWFKLKVNKNVGWYFGIPSRN